MGRVVAPITGTVLQIQVEVGAAVAIEQTLAILESMKLQIPVDATAPGTVARILVSSGDAVSEGDVLFELD